MKKMRVFRYCPDCENRPPGVGHDINFLLPETVSQVVRHFNHVRSKLFQCQALPGHLLRYGETPATLVPVADSEVIFQAGRIFFNQEVFRE